MTCNITPVVTFVGTTPNIGTTAAAFATAYRIAERCDSPVGYLCLNLKSAKLHRYIGIDHPSVTLDSLRPELKSGALTAGRLTRSAYRMPGNPGLHVLFGNLMRDQAEFYSPEDIMHLLAAAKEAFRLTITDVNAYWDNAATVAALRQSGSRVLTTTAALSSFQEDGQRWIGQVSPLFGIPSDGYESIVIHPPWRNGGYPMRDIRKETGLKMIGDLRMTEAMLSQLDNGRLGDWLQTDPQGKKVMDETSRRLMERHAIAGKMDMKRQPWYRKLLAHRNGAGS